MPYSRAELSAEVRARLAADLPIVAARNAATLARRVEWRVGGSWGAGVDLSARGAPARCACDDAHHAPTRPSTNGLGLTHYLLFDLPDVDFDTALVLGHNGSALSGVTSLRLEVADDQTYTTNLETVVQWSSQLDRRLVSVTLGAGLPGVLVGCTYSGVRYLRLRVAYSGTAPHPEVAEVMLLRRQALPYRPNTPHDEEALETLTHTLETESGDEHTVTRYRGRHVLSASFEIDTDDEIAAWRAWHRDAGFGTRPWVWMPRPSSDPRRAYVMRPGGSLGLALPVREGVARGTMSLAGVEQGPFYAREIAA